MWKDDGDLIFETEEEARDNLWENFDLYTEEISDFLEARGICYFDFIKAILTNSEPQISEIREAIYDAFDFLFNEYYSESEE
jgi:predicted RNase H-like HicB family nuclease